MPAAKKPETAKKPKKAAVVELDLDHPLTSLREAAQLTVPELARRRGIDRSTVRDAEEQGDRITLSNLRAYADVIECDVTITLVPK